MVGSRVRSWLSKLNNKDTSAKVLDVPHPLFGRLLLSGGSRPVTASTSQHVDPAKPADESCELQEPRGQRSVADVDPALSAHGALSQNTEDAEREVGVNVQKLFDDVWLAPEEKVDEDVKDHTGSGEADQ